MTLKRYLCIVRAVFLSALVFKMKSKEQVEGKNIEIVLAMKELSFRLDTRKIIRHPRA